FYGNNPAHMGVGPALATNEAVGRAGISFDQLDQIELHEPFAATVLSIFKLGQQKYGHNWTKKWQENKINPNGGTLALGHPLGATGIRLLLNLLYAYKENPVSKYGLIAGCSGGGVGGAMIFEKA
ncbi:MAG: thiolase family protein, partial [Elusimicrobia bacterium]|nr:thiolase family protein [Elusimicrobiota bacterium]